MKQMWTAAATLALCGLLAGPGAADEAKTKPKIEIAILLDTSGSMEGLINQARTKLWAIVNQLAIAEKGGQVPDLRVGLYEYGKDSVPAEAGFVRQILPLTDDLDKISAELFALKTDGGSEFCGLVIQKAMDELAWSAGEHYKAIFIAGNEPFTQGPLDYTKACAAAIAKGIVVNTIHCGSEKDGIDGKWRHGAQLADGQALNIDQNAATVTIATPMDAKLEELSGKLNGTYLGFGAQGIQRQDMQVAQDANATQAAPSAAAERALSKCNAQYDNGAWDLVDACRNQTVNLLEMKEADLPEELRKMTPSERKAFVEQKAAVRATLQEEIRKLSAERDGFLAVEQKKLAEQGTTTFDSAVHDVLNDQLESRGYYVRK